MVRSATVVGLMASLLLSACGTERSPEAFCSTMEKHKVRYLDRMGQADEAMRSGDSLTGLVGLATGVSAFADLTQMWEELADVSPDEIKPDVEDVRDAFQKQLDSMGQAAENPLGALVSNLSTGLAVSGAMQRVDTFTRDQCD